MSDMIEDASQGISFVCNNIAEVYAKRDLFSKAIHWQERDVLICEKTIGMNHPDTATSYNNMGLIYYEMGCPKDALNWYEKAITIRHRFFGEDNTVYKNSIRNAQKAYYSIYLTFSGFDSWISDLLRK